MTKLGNATCKKWGSNATKGCKPSAIMGELRSEQLFGHVGTQTIQYQGTQTIPDVEHTYLFQKWRIKNVKTSLDM